MGAPGGARVPRHRLAFAVSATFAALPVLIADNLPAPPGSSERVAAAALPERAPFVERPSIGSPAPQATAALADPVVVAVDAAPAVEPGPDTAREPADAPDPAPSPPPAPAPTPPSAPPPPPANLERGQATWYSQPSGYGAGGCAHRTLPMGTVVTIVNLADGASTTCVVNDRGPFGEGRIIDLDDDVFARLAPTSAGVIDVEIRW